MSKGRTKTSGAERLTPVRKTVFEHLRKEILDGTLKDGERLIETEIAKKLEVSRTPVREAFRKLENEGLVEYSPGKGVTVTILSREDMMELYSIRGALAGLAARFAAERITQEELTRVGELLSKMEDAYRSGDLREAVRVHTEFNEVLYRAARSPRIYEMVNRFQEYTERSQLRALSVPERFPAIQEEHRQIADALASGGPDAAEAAVRHHIEQARLAYLKTLTAEDFLDEISA